MNKMEAFNRCQDRNWVANSTIQFHLDYLKPDSLVKTIFVVWSLSGTKGETDTESGDTFGLAVDYYRIPRFVEYSGLDCDFFYRTVFGQRNEQRTAIPGSGTEFTINFTHVIPFADERNADPLGSAVPARLLHPYALDISTAGAGVYGDDIEITSGTIKIFADIVDYDKPRVPELRQIGTLNPGGQDMILPDGGYIDLFLSKTDAADFTAAEITAVDTEISGKTYRRNQSQQELCAGWNHKMCQDIYNASWEKEGMVLPIIYSDNRRMHISKHPDVLGGGSKIQLRGTLTDPHGCYWRTVYREQSEEMQILHAQGVATPRGAQMKMLADKGISGQTSAVNVLRRKLPMKMGLQRKSTIVPEAASVNQLPSRAGNAAYNQGYPIILGE